MSNTVPMQLYSLLIFTISGIAIGIFFDVFRILRKSFKTSNIITYIEDILFWIISGIFFIFILFKFNNGQIRNYVIIGLLFGITIYMFTLSKYFIKLCVKIISIIKKILYFPYNLIIKFFNKLSKPVSFIVINLRKMCKKIVIKEIILKKCKENVKKM